MFGEIIFDATVALLAAVGISAVIWMLIELAFERSAIKKNMYMCTVIAANGKTGDLQHTIRSFVRVNSAPNDKHQLFIADFGMNDKDIECATLAAKQYENIFLIQ
ncbi:MAG: hypothetical protein PHH84_09595, partial [Oscillospiraceae bacterium]|nr:hypothetical protein [Oscillospiraceae bacterium]